MRKLKTVEQVFRKELKATFRSNCVEELCKLKNVKELSHFSMEELSYLWTLFSEEYGASFLSTAEEMIEEFLYWLEEDN